MKFKAMSVAAIAAAIALAGTVGTANGTGNGAPSGSHYTLNIIGVDKGKNPPMDGTNRHTIFVPLSGNCQISLAVGDFGVADGNCFDGDGAAFSLPNPDPLNTGSTLYSVFARALGTPGGGSSTTTCATDPTDGAEVCSVISLELDREAGRTQFTNASKYLLYIYADLDGDGATERYPLFSDRLEGYFWDYDNSGLRIAQLRFYDCTTVVPDGTDPGGPQDDSDCF